MQPTKLFPGLTRGQWVKDDRPSEISLHRDGERGDQLNGCIFGNCMILRDEITCRYLSGIIPHNDDNNSFGPFLVSPLFFFRVPV